MSLLSDWVEDVPAPVGRYFVTGAAGSIGGALFDTLEDVQGCDYHEEAVARRPEILLGDYLDFTRIAKQADYIIHAAAYKHVPLGECEQNRASFYFNNFVKLHEFAEEVGKPILLCSSDKAAGMSYMGSTKKKAEDAVVTLGGWALRMVNVAYSRGSCLDNWQQEATIKLVKNDCYRYFMTKKDAVNLLLATLHEAPGLYTAYGFPELSVRELGMAYAKQSGKSIEWMDLRLGEKEREELISKEETLEVCNHPYLRRIV